MPLQKATEESRHPFELFLLVSCVLLGLYSVFFSTATLGVVGETMPDLIEGIWSWMLFTGSALALIGIFLKNRVNGLLCEQVGVAALGVAASMYSLVVLFTVRCFTGLFTAVVLAWFGFACWRRWKQIQDKLDLAQRIAEGNHSE